MIGKNAFSFFWNLGEKCNVNVLSHCSAGGIESTLTCKEIQTPHNLVRARWRKVARMFAHLLEQNPLGPGRRGVSATVIQFRCISTYI